MAFGKRSPSRLFFPLDIFVLVSFSLMFTLSPLFPSSTNVINLTGHSLYSRSFYPVLSKLFLAFIRAFHFFLSCFPALFPFFLFLPSLFFLFAGAWLQSGCRRARQATEIKISTRDTAIRRVWPQCRLAKLFKRALGDLKRSRRSFQREWRVESLSHTAKPTTPSAFTLSSFILLPLLIE